LFLSSCIFFNDINILDDICAAIKGKVNIMDMPEITFNIGKPFIDIVQHEVG